LRQVDALEKLYQDNKDIVEFRIIYIKEAHAADGDWPMDYAKELNITEHDDLPERCATAEKLLKDKSLTIPCVADGMDDAVNKAYHAWPDRIFVVRRDGLLAVAAGQGPWGFEPGLRATEKWLEEFRKTGKEPELPPKSTDSKAEAGANEPQKNTKK
jgi:Iodothyronine deiodinase